MYVYVYLYMCIYVNMYVHVYMYVCVYVCMHICIYAYTYVFVDVYEYEYMCIWMCACATTETYTVQKELHMQAPVGENQAYASSCGRKSSWALQWAKGGDTLPFSSHSLVMELWVVAPHACKHLVYLGHSTL